MRRHAWRGFGIVLAGLAAVGSYSLAKMIADRQPPIHYVDARALSPTAPQGGKLAVEFTVIRERHCDLEVRRTLTDSEGVRHTIPSYTVGFPNTLGREQYQREITVPTWAAVGPATYDVRLAYYCNPLHFAFGWPIEVGAPPIDFEIERRRDWMLPLSGKSNRVLTE